VHLNFNITLCAKEYKDIYTYVYGNELSRYDGFDDFKKSVPDYY